MDLKPFEDLHAHGMRLARWILDNCPPNDDQAEALSHLFQALPLAARSMGGDEEATAAILKHLQAYGRIHERLRRTGSA